MHPSTHPGRARIHLIKDARGSCLALGVGLGLDSFHIGCAGRVAPAHELDTAARVLVGDGDHPVVAHSGSLRIQQIIRDRLGLGQSMPHDLAAHFVALVPARVV